MSTQAQLFAPEDVQEAQPVVLSDVAERRADGMVYRRQADTCRYCGSCTNWRWSPVAQVWGCAECMLGQGSIERSATPAEVDDGHELGIAWDPIGGWPA